MAINLSAFAGAGAQFFDDNGDPLSGGLLYVYAAGTTTPVTTYTTVLGTVNNTNPIVLDAAGRTPNEIWVNGGVLYKFTLRTSLGVLIGTYDNIPAIDDPTVFNNLITVTGTNTLTGTSVPPISGYVTGATYSFIPLNTNTGAVTIDIDLLGAKEITYDQSTSLSAGALQAGKMALIEYDGTRFQLVNSFVTGQIPDGSITVAKLAADTRSDVASATTISLTALSPATRNIRITGSTGPIGTFTVAAGFDYFVVFSGAPTITNSASIVTNTNADIIVNPGDSCIIRSTAANVVEILNFTRALPFLRGYIDGLVMSTAGSSATMSVAAGQATNSTNVVMLNLAASISKTTSAWAVGTGNGGIDTGSIANSTWYYFYLIRRPDTGVVDVIFSTSASSPTLPTNYTQYRYIGAGLTNGSAQWTAFIQDADLFTWSIPILDVNATGAGTSAVTRTLSVPRKNVVALMNVRLTAGASGDACYISDLADSDQAPSSTAAPLSSIEPSGTNASVAAQVQCRTNTSAQIRSRQAVGDGSCILRIATFGWVDQRGKNA